MIDLAQPRDLVAYVLMALGLAFDSPRFGRMEREMTSTREPIRATPPLRTGMSWKTLEQIIEASTGESAAAIDFLTIDDQVETLHADAQILRECKLFPDGVEVGEFIFDVHGGSIEQIA